MYQMLIAAFGATHLTSNPIKKMKYKSSRIARTTSSSRALQVLVFSTLGLLAAPYAIAQTAPAKATPNKASSSQDEEVITLSPFEVDASKDTGYYAENTLAGSRLNTNIGDLASSITVVTKQQMEDTASLDINDVFRYEANTEGSSTYTPTITDRGTAKDTISGYTAGNDGSLKNNAGSNRVRGLASPDNSLNYFPSNSKIPFDSYNIQSIEISRGPNSLLFGLGSPAGMVNQTVMQANLDKNTAQMQLRTDQYGSYRGSLNFNRVVLKGKLAIAGAVLYNNEQFNRKPSYDLTHRQYGAITYKPFKKTTIRAFAEAYTNSANRPNFITPRDFVTPWLKSGRPSYDPVTRMVTVLDTGVSTGPYVLSTMSPGYVTGTLASTAALSATTSSMYVPGIGFSNAVTQRIDGDNQVDYYQRQNGFYAPAQTNPATAVPTFKSLGWTTGDSRFLIYDRQYTSSINLPTPSNYSTYTLPGVTDKSIYDYTKYNTNQANFAHTRANNYSLEFEQEILPNLFFNAGYLRQEVDEVSNNTISQLTGATLQIDTNTKLTDGSENKYFGLPFISDIGPDTFFGSEVDTNYRAMMAYQLDFTKTNNWTRWFGRHVPMAMWSEQDVHGQWERWRNGFVSGDADGTLRFVPNLTTPGRQTWSSTNLSRNYYMASPGSDYGRVSHSVGSYGNKGWNSPFTTGITVYNYDKGAFQTDSVTERISFAHNGSYRYQREVKSKNIALTSYLFDERLVTTVGFRHDDYRARRTTTGAITTADNVMVEPALADSVVYPYLNGQANYDLVMNRYNRWDKLSGNTKTYGGAFRPMKDLKFTKGDSLLAEFLGGLTLYYNHSDNFNPPSEFKTDFFGKSLPKPTGTGKDIGIGFSLLNNKLVARVNWFKVQNKSERTSAASTLLNRLAYGDTTLMYPWAATIVRLRHGVDPMSSASWNTEGTNPIETNAVWKKEVYDLMQLPQDYYASVYPAGTQDSEAKGTEFQLTYNPLPYWTIKGTFSKQETVYNSVAPEYDAWLAVRYPVWTKAAVTDIPDFTDFNGTKYSLSNFWAGYGFTSAARESNTDGNTSVGKYFENTVESQVALAKALEGAVASDQRKYHGSLVTNFAVPRGALKGWSIGGAERYESRAVIGYYGYAATAATPNLINRSDVNRPVYDSGHFYSDFWLAYQTKILTNKVGMKIQLNVNDAFEGCHLQAFSVNWDGSPWAYRIVDGRKFVLTTTFSF
jgi:hypothetical protein